MKKITVGFLLVITAIFISACGNKSNAPENVREDVWNNGIQFAIFMKDTINEEKNIEGFHEAFEDYFTTYKEDATEEEKKILDALKATQLIYGVTKAIQSGSGFATDEGFNEMYKHVEEAIGVSNLEYKNYDKEGMEKTLSKYE
ncbi:hypothetical protein ACIQ7N_02425 [Lysinibacillus sp. NPDC095746]|uniref:hypothetical protein n=1 Tax=Lysinibacillus sp. NPDC095746 TaxID=3364134 RepID=UPI0037FE74B7